MLATPNQRAAGDTQEPGRAIAQDAWPACWPWHRGREGRSDQRGRAAGRHGPSLWTESDARVTPRAPEGRVGPRGRGGSDLARQTGGDEPAAPAGALMHDNATQRLMLASQNEPAPSAWPCSLQYLSDRWFQCRSGVRVGAVHRPGHQPRNGWRHRCHALRRGVPRPGGARSASVAQGSSSVRGMPRVARAMLARRQAVAMPAHRYGSCSQYPPLEAGYADGFSRFARLQRIVRVL
jgi:hypothetical protein